MRVILKPSTLVIVAETEAERDALAAWQGGLQGHVFALQNAGVTGAVLHDLGPREDACRVPINIVYDMVEARWQPISNLAETHFVLDGRSYASIEGFWQGLKFDHEKDRARVATLSGKPAKNAPRDQPPITSFSYGGADIAVGGPGHHALMFRACRAKFTQHLVAREALLSTGDRPLVHRVRRDSRTIPGALMADMWTRIRASLRGDAERLEG